MVVDGDDDKRSKEDELLDSKKTKRHKKVDGTSASSTRT
jgi:hypothetical protein